MRVRVIVLAAATMMAGAALAQPPNDRPPPPVAISPTPLQSEYSQGRQALYRGEGAEAVRLLTIAAQKGSADAENDLGEIFRLGAPGVARDCPVAMDWYRKASSHGDQWGALNLGVSYHNGECVQRDLTEALTWYRLAAERGNTFAQANIGNLYLYGAAGLKADPAEAQRWLRMAAAKDNNAGQFNLGEMYRQGLGVRRDYGEAMAWYRKVTDRTSWNNYADPAVKRMIGVAHLRVATLYAEGQGVRKDKAEARRWMEKAAGHGNEEARAWLAANRG